MSRERQLAGVDSYARELGFNPIDVLAAGLTGTGYATSASVTAAGLDLCCGTGRALIQAARELRRPLTATTTPTQAAGPTSPSDLRVCA
jgi:hypothetical protein